MNVNSGSEGGTAGSGVPGSGTAAEAKRMAARRRFLLGGATALPLIVTLGQREAWAASAAVCQSLGLGFDRGYAEAHHGPLSEDDLDDLNDDDDGFKISAYCDPNNSWR